MRIEVRKGPFSPTRDDIEPLGEVVWRNDGDQMDLPAAILTTLGQPFEPGTWYSIDEFKSLVEGMIPKQGQEEVSSAVAASQAGVESDWTATISVGQSEAALMVGRSVLEFALRQPESNLLWVRVD